MMFEMYRGFRLVTEDEKVTTGCAVWRVGRLFVAYGPEHAKERIDRMVKAERERFIRHAPQHVQ